MTKLQDAARELVAAIDAEFPNGMCVDECEALSAALAAEARPRNKQQQPTREQLAEALRVCQRQINRFLQSTDEDERRESFSGFVKADKKACALLAKYDGVKS